jgi:hypothetical protein
MIVCLNLLIYALAESILRQVKTTMEYEMRLQRDSPGDAIGRESWPSPLQGDPDATCFPVNQGQCKKRSNE